MLRNTISLLILTASLLLGGCVRCDMCGRPNLTPQRPARINHLAFFTLQDADDADELIADCDEFLATIPGAVSYYAGKHIDVGRASVDGAYDVGFFIGFDTVDAYLAYVEHPNHKAVVTKWKPRLKSLRVHDILDDTP